MLVENTEFEVTEEGVGTLAITGYLRGRDLDVNRLIKLPGHGACQMIRIVQAADPCLGSAKAARQSAAPGTVLAEADPALQESLQSEVPIDPLAAEQTWPTPEELANAAMEQDSGAVKVLFILLYLIMLQLTMV